MASLIDKARTRLDYAENELGSGDKTAALGHLLKAGDFVGRVAAEIAPAPAVEDDAGTEDGLFRVFDDEEAVYLQGGSAFGNPNGVSFSIGDAKRWWQGVFDGGLNIGKVRPTLTPGSYVLSAEGLETAQELGRSSTTFAEADYNPLDLEVTE